MLIARWYYENGVTQVVAFATSEDEGTCVVDPSDVCSSGGSPSDSCWIVPGTMMPDEM